MTVEVELGGQPLRRGPRHDRRRERLEGPRDHLHRALDAGAGRARPARPGESSRLCNKRFRPRDASGSRRARHLRRRHRAVRALRAPVGPAVPRGPHVWAQIEDGIVTVGVTAPLGEVLWYTPDVEYWAVDRVDVGETLATVQGRSGRTVAVGSPVRGALVELNPLLRRAPHALLAQPYGRGWVARISADRWERDEAAMVPGPRLPQDPRRRSRARARVLLRRRAARAAAGRSPKAAARRGRGLGALDARAHDLVLVVEAVHPARLRVGEPALVDGPHPAAHDDASRPPR